MKYSLIVLITMLISSIVCCQQKYTSEAPKNFSDTLAYSALSIVDPSIIYDPGYYIIDYPNGDVEKGTGVCTDVVIRTFRKQGIDLQQLVHEDMKKNFSRYPKNWGLKNPDKNIDHRRVPNLMTFFSRFGKLKKISNNKDDFSPGDIITWDLGNGILHIGMVSPNKTSKGVLLVVHNIGSGQVEENILFNWRMVGHYSFEPLDDF